MSILTKFAEMPNDSRQKTLAVALLLCLVCSVAVSTSAVALKAKQEQNKLEDKRRNILQIAGLMKPGKSVEELFKQVEARVVNLDTGDYDRSVDPATYDQRAAASIASQSISLNRDIDIASIKRRAHLATVYLVRDPERQLQKIILPVHGYGLWSTLYGFLALQANANTIIGLGFYEHAETPGLGGEVDNPQWKAKWVGKEVFDEQGRVAISVVKHAATTQPQANYQVDALSGASLTSRGVNNLLHFWLGDNGFGPYLKKIRHGEGT
ncbi:MAG: Na(+)-translocating NADH-quinone reductase subunit C [Proteobacteria bacterium]|nr:MAG: Na(+)-translocating NADH-quinone reductase subunit C [Pseudomonadota bacterium]